MEYARLRRRIAAHFIDFLLLLIVMAALVFAGLRQQNIEILLTPVRGALLFLFTFYFHGKSGQTPGKKWLGIMVVDWQGKKIGFMQSAQRNLMLFLMSIPWPIATVIALNRIPPEQYIELWGHGEAALEASLRPEWYGQLQPYMLGIFVIDILFLVVSKNRRSLHDYIGRTSVVRVRTEGALQ
jgi:uncharacterized RDD family membrane protein YckC